MDLQAIEDAIEDLQQLSTSENNVQELACLYIVRDHLKNENLTVLNDFKQQANEVLPAYKNYCVLKRNYQLGEGSEQITLQGLSLLCDEIKDLYRSLYASSASRKERRILKESIESLQNLIQ